MELSANVLNMVVCALACAVIGIVVYLFLISYRVSDMEVKQKNFDARIASQATVNGDRFMRHMKFITDIKEAVFALRAERCHDAIRERDIYIISKEQYLLDHSTKGNYFLRYRENIDELSITDDSTGEVIVIHDVQGVVGEGLKHFGEMSGDANTIYVRNKNFNVDFEIVKVKSDA